jgi:hypothetical protein
MRGYDDTQMLSDMARGMFSRRYGSVDEAAKAVAGEDGGSNVDRLRRKFRTEGWFEKGLNEYVEATIKARGLVTPEVNGNVMYVASLFWSKCREWTRIVLGTIDMFTTFVGENRRRLGYREQLGRGLTLMAPLLVVFMVALVGAEFFKPLMDQGIAQGLAEFRQKLPSMLIDILTCSPIPLACWLGGERLSQVRWNTIYKKIKAEGRETKGEDIAVIQAIGNG